ELKEAAEAARDAAAERKTQAAAGSVAIDIDEARAVVVDQQCEPARRTLGRHVNVSRSGGARVREQVAEDHAQRRRREREGGRQVGRDREVGPEILDGLVEALDD